MTTIRKKFLYSQTKLFHITAIVERDGEDYEVECTLNVFEDDNSVLLEYRLTIVDSPLIELTEEEREDIKEKAISCEDYIC